MKDVHDTIDVRREPGTFRRQFGALLLLGLLGVVSLVPLLFVQLEAPAQELAGIPLWAAVLISLVEPVILVAGAVAIGVLLAPKVGLRSLVADRVRGGKGVWPGLRPDLALAVGLGLVVAAVISVVDAVAAPQLGMDIPEEPLSWFPRLVLGMLYGGVTEELLLRWGLMTALVWAGHRVFGRDRPRPSGAVVWAAILVTAVVFGLAHLPAMSVYAELTPVLIARTVALNALGGVVFGWLYWRRSLEAAMVAHASAHLGFAALLPLLGNLP